MARRKVKDKDPKESDIEKGDKRSKETPEGREVVDIEKVAEEEGIQEGTVKGYLSPTQRVAYRLAVCVGILIFLIVVFLAIVWFSSVPSMKLSEVPELDTEDIGKIKDMISNYTTIYDTVSKRVIELFDAIVVRVLLPVFTSLLGYIFGTQVVEREES